MGLNNLTLTQDVDLLLSTTLARYQPRFADGVSTHIPYLFFLIDKGMKDVVSGGHVLRYPIHGANNDTFQSYAAYGDLNTTPQDNQVFSQWKWKNLAVSITIDGPTLRKNSGSDIQVINLLNTKVEEAEIAMREGIADQLFGSGDDDSNDLNGLQNILPDSTTSGTTGTLNRATNEFWRHQSANVSSAFATNGRTRMVSLYNSCMAGTQRVNLIILTQSAHQLYELEVATTAAISQRFVVQSPFENIKGDFGYHVLRFKGVPIIWDNNVVANAGYFINTDTIKWVVHEDANFATRPFIPSGTQDAKVSQILVMANQVCTNLKRNGILRNADS